MVQYETYTAYKCDVETWSLSCPAFEINNNYLDSEFFNEGEGGEV